MWAAVVLEANPVSVGAGCVVSPVDVPAVYALLLQTPDHSLDRLTLPLIMAVYLLCLPLAG